MAQSASESRHRNEAISGQHVGPEANQKASHFLPSMHQQGVPLRRSKSPASRNTQAHEPRSSPDPMNAKGKSPPAMSYGQLNKDRAQILWDMTCEEEERERFEAEIRHWKEQLQLLPQTEEGQQTQLQVKQRISDVYLKMQAQLGTAEECRQRQEFRETQLQYIDQLLAEGNLQLDSGSDEVRNYAADGSRERPVKIHRSNTLGEGRNSRRLHVTNSSGVPGKRPSNHQSSPNCNGVHIRQRSNPEQGRLVHDIMMRARIEAANSVGDLPVDLPQLLQGRMSRSPGHSSEHLDSSSTSINSFNLQGRPSTNASLQSLDAPYSHGLLSVDDAYLTSSDHRDFPQFSDSCKPSMAVLSMRNPQGQHGRSFSADSNDVRGDLRPSHFVDQRMTAVPTMSTPSPNALPSHLQALARDAPLASKVEMIQSLLTMLRPSDQDEMSRTLLAMANSKESCVAMRQAGCIPLLLQILHPRWEDGVVTRASREAKMRATAALHNIIHLQGHSQEAVREMNILRLLEQVRTLTDVRRLQAEKASNHHNIPLTSANMKLMAEHQRPGQGIESLMHLSFKTEYRQAILLLGGLFAVAELLEADHKANAMSSVSLDDSDIYRIHPGIDIRKHCCMILTNLTFGGGTVKSELCQMINCLHIIVLQLESQSEELVHSAANILRNLSWNAEDFAKQALRSCGAVRGLIRASNRVRDEATMRALTSALWNLSAHLKENKAEICSEPDGLRVILHLLRHWTSTKYPEDIVQNAAGILLNISSYVSSREVYRRRLRDSGLYEVLVALLKSGSHEMLKKVCGIVWNLSSRSSADQAKLWDLGAVQALFRLTTSVNEPEIRRGAAQALKNLMQAKEGGHPVSLGMVAEAAGNHQRRKREPGVGMDASLMKPSQLNSSGRGRVSGYDSPPRFPGSSSQSAKPPVKPPPKPRRMFSNTSVEMKEVIPHGISEGSATPPLTSTQLIRGTHSRSHSAEMQPVIIIQHHSKGHGSGLSSESDRFSTSSSSSTGSIIIDGRRQRRSNKTEANGGSPTLETQL